MYANSASSINETGRRASGVNFSQNQKKLFEKYLFNNLQISLKNSYILFLVSHSEVFSNNLNQLF
jgi:hypothetical protein